MSLQRREFLTYAGVAGLAAAGISDSTTAAEGAGRTYIELRKYTFETEAQRAGFETFMAEAAIAALNRLKVGPVGVFYPSDTALAAYVLLRHPSGESAVTLTEALMKDAVLLEKGAAFLDAAAESAAYKRIESSLLAAIEGMPRLEQPVAVTTPGRVFQLRIYESPSVKTNLKKIEMFNKGELAIFRKTGLNPVFFGQALIGPAMPNLTYMLAFEDMEQQKKAWDTFRTDPDWLTIRAIPEYSDKRILCGITNIELRPAACSQI